MVTAIDETEIPDLKLLFRGKVRDMYDLGEQLLMVATDRICTSSARGSRPEGVLIISRISPFLIKSRTLGRPS